MSLSSCGGCSSFASLTPLPPPPPHLHHHHQTTCDNIVACYSTPWHAPGTATTTSRNDPDDHNHGDRDHGAHFHHDDLGWLCYFCDVDVASAGGLTVTPRDSYRRRVFLASFGILITSDAGVLQRVVWDPKYPARVRVVYAPVGAQPLTRFRLRLRGCGESSAYKFKVDGHTESRGAWDVAAAAGGGETTVDFTFGTHL